MYNVENLFDAANRVKKQKSIKNQEKREKYIDNLKSLILEEHEEAKAYLKSILLNEDTTIKYDTSSENITYEICTNDEKININISKVNGSYSMISIKNEGKDNEVENKYMYERQLDGYMTTTFYREKNEKSDNIDCTKNMYVMSKSKDIYELVDTYKYKKTKDYSYILEESKVDDKWIETLQVLRKSFYVDTNIRGIRQNDGTVHFCEGMCCNYILSDDLYFTGNTAEEFIAKRVAELENGKKMDMDFKREYFFNNELLYAKDKNIKNGTNELRKSLNEKFDFNNEQIDKAFKSAEKLYKYKNKLDEEVTCLEMDKNSSYISTKRYVPVFYLYPQLHKIFYNNKEMQDSLIIEKFANPEEIGVYEDKLFKKNNTISRAFNIYAEFESNLIANDEFILSNSINRVKSYKTDENIPVNIKDDASCVVSTEDAKFILMKSYKFDKSLYESTTYEYIPDDENACGIRSKVRLGVSNDRDVEVDVANIYGPRYRNEETEMYDFSEVWYANAKRTVGKNEIYASSLKDENSKMKIKDKINKETFSQHEVPFYCAEISDLGEPLPFYATVDDIKLTNLFVITDEMHKIVVESEDDLIVEDEELNQKIETEVKKLEDIETQIEEDNEIINNDREE